MNSNSHEAYFARSSNANVSAFLLLIKLANAFAAHLSELSKPSVLLMLFMRF